MKIDQLKDFNEVVKYYDEVLDFARKIKQKPNNIRNVVEEIIKFERLYSLSTMAKYRILASNISLYISQVHERTKEIHDDDLLDAAFSEIESMNNIISKNNNISLSEKKRQIRNCLAHADYNLVLEDIESHDLSNELVKKATAVITRIYIEIENDFIKGKIPFEDLQKFAEKYKDAYSYMKHGYDITFLLTLNHNYRIRTARDYLDNSKRIRITRKKDESEKSFEKFKYWFIRNNKIQKEEKAYIETILGLIKQDFKSFNFQEEELRPETKELINKYIQYIGLNELLCNTYASKALDEINAANNEKMLPIDLLTGIVSTIDELKLQADLLCINPLGFLDESVINILNEKVKELLKYSYQAPMIYANNLLGMAYYMFNYTREINEQSGQSYFNYYNIKNLDGIEAVIEDKKGKKKNMQIEVNPLDKLNNLLNEVAGQINKLQEQKGKKESTKRNLENPKNKNPKKQEIIDAIDEWLNDYPEEEKKLLDKKRKIERDIESEKEKGINNKDSSDFFRHLRNSMAHGNYTIIYGDFNNLSDIKYIFKDEDEKTKSVYIVELTSEQLEKILQAFQLKVNECDKGYLDGKKMERDIIEYAVNVHQIGSEDVNQEIENEELNTEEKGDKGSGEQK